MSEDTHDSPLIHLTVTEIVSNQGSIVVLEGIEYETDLVYRFGADWRPARAIAEALEAGEDVEVSIEGWQVLGSARPAHT